MLKYMNPSDIWFGTDQSRPSGPTTYDHGYNLDLVSKPMFKPPQMWSFDPGQAYSTFDGQLYTQQDDMSGTSGADTMAVDAKQGNLDGTDGVHRDTQRQQTDGETEPKPTTKRGRPLKLTLDHTDNTPSRQHDTESASSSRDGVNSGSSSKTKNREAFLARNRAAAHKCRQRKKEWSGRLQEHARELQIINRDLHVTAQLLKDELLGLQSELLRHGNCNSSLIREYIVSAASHVAPSFMTPADAKGSCEARPSSSHAASLQEQYSPHSSFVDGASPTEVKMEDEPDAWLR